MGNGAGWLRALGALACGVSIVLAGADRPFSQTAVTAQQIRSLIDAGRYADAEREAERTFGWPASRTLTSLEIDSGDVLADALVLNGRGAEPRTRQLGEQLLAGRAALVPHDERALAISHRRLAAILFETGEYQQAMPHATEALSLLERARANSSDVADALDDLARILTRTGEYDRALPICDRAVLLREASQSEAIDGITRTLVVRGDLLLQKGEYPRARQDLARALELLEKSRPIHPETARALTLVGEEARREGFPVRANEILSRAVSMTKATLRIGHPALASSLGSLAAALVDLGDFTRARMLLEEAQTIAEDSFGPDHPAVAVQLNDRAATLYLQGEYASARPLYERAMRIYERRFGPDYVGVTTAVYNLALLNSDLGDQQEARRYYQRAIETWSRTLGPQHTVVAFALSAYASFLARQGLFKEAQGFYQRALTIRERELGPNHPLVADTLTRSSLNLSRLGQRQQALELSARALQLWEKAGAQDGLAGGLIAQAQVFQNADDQSAARSYERALDIRRPLLGPAHPGIAEIEVPLAMVQARLGKRQDAFERALRGEEIGRNHSRLTLGYLSERQALDYASTRPRGLDLALSLIDEPRQATQALDALVRGRALTLDEIGARRRVSANQTSGALAPLWTALVSTRQRYANLVVRGAGSLTTAQYNALVDEARREKEQAERALAEQSATFRSEQARAEIGLEHVRASLPPSSALISFVRFNRTTVPAPAAVPSYLAFILKAGSADPEVVSIGRADQIESLISRWRNAMTAGIALSATSAIETERAFRITGGNLRRRLWDPISARLEGINRVFVVPDDAINLVPLAALPTGTARYLVEDGPVIHYLSTERDLVGTERPREGSGRGLLAVGGAAFADGSLFASLGNSKPQPAQTPAVATMAAASFRGTGSPCGSFQAMQFPAIPGSAREAREVADLWRSAPSPNGSGDVSALIGRDASEHAIKQLALGRRILHLATHGFFLGDECSSPLEGTRAVGGLVGAAGPRPAPAQRARPQELPENPLLLSGLALAGANRRAAAGPDEDDGILTAEEVTSLNLEGVEWAVLSACDTGLGQLRAGEGVFGLRRAFQIAGARTVVMSLWPVDDSAARVWMRALYEGRLDRQLDTANSVREASLVVLRDRRARKQSTHPFYWAGFVAAGDWR